MTVEAACILPLFLFSILAFFYVMYAVRAELCVFMGLWEAGEDLALYTSLTGEEEDGKNPWIEAGISGIYGRTQVTQRLRQDGEGVSVIYGGESGISFLGSSYAEQDMIRMQAAYQLHFPVPIPGLQKIPVKVTARVRAWTGREAQEEVVLEEGKETCVYVTTTGKVYHLDRECTHIRLSIRRVKQTEIPGLRNTAGEKYVPCESCKDAQSDMVYITDTGNRYHSTSACRGLKRGVMQIPLSELEGWQACKRCGGA